ncbi:MAG: hypothetical protein ACR2I4_11235 [Actinomycetota bacterium]|jgi:hypothetical protein|nr:hypothetical protein [Actinomycetota bacterium]MDQ3218374.1 hypothetical protein [Actinomycetota bacterium]
MEVLIGVLVLSGVIGLILEAARVNTRRDQQELESLRVLVERKREGINGRKAS